MRVLHVIQVVAPAFGGPATAVLGMAQAVRRFDVEAEIYTTDLDIGGRLNVPVGQKIETGGVPTTFFPVQGSRRRFRFSWQMAAALKRNIGQFDAVHIHSLYAFSSLAAARYCRKEGVPYIVRPHGTLDPYHYQQRRLLKAPYEALIERRNIARAAAIHFTSDEEMRLAGRTRWCFRGVVVPLGVDLPVEAPYSRATAESLWPRSRGKRIVLFLGRIDEKKGLDFLIPAFASMTWERPDLHLLVAGPENDGYGRKVRKWVGEWRIEDKVTLAGMLTGEAKRTAFSAASLFVLPSRGENFGVAVAEAMAAGLPVVVSEHVNIAPQIIAADAGIAVPLQVDELRAAIAVLLDNPDRALTMGRNARALAQAQFSWDRVGARLAELYRSIAFPRKHVGQDVASRQGVGS